MKRAMLTDWEPQRALLLGDAHGNSRFMEYAASIAATNGCEVIIQLGDFGYWEHTLGGREYLDRVERAARECETPVLFIDGNHENHDMLHEYVESGRVGPDGLVWVRPNVAWVTRGTRWTWQDRIFAAVGGAASVDRAMRTPGWTWWPGEVLHRADVEHLLREPVDVVLSHDAPQIANMKSQRSFPAEDLERAFESRAVLDLVIESCRPELVAHGHWHIRHTTTVGGVRIEGFADDNSRFPNAAGILDLSSLDVLSMKEPLVLY